MFEDLIAASDSFLESVSGEMMFGDELHHRGLALAHCCSQHFGSPNSIVVHHVGSQSAGETWHMANISWHHFVGVFIIVSPLVAPSEGSETVPPDSVRFVLSAESSPLDPQQRLAYVRKAFYVSGEILSRRRRSRSPIKGS